jgi:hypothetical protein
MYLSTQTETTTQLWPALRLTRMRGMSEQIQLLQATRAPYEELRLGMSRDVEDEVYRQTWERQEYKFQRHKRATCLFLSHTVGHRSTRLLRRQDLGEVGFICLV